MATWTTSGTSNVTGAIWLTWAGSTATSCTTSTDFIWGDWCSTSSSTTATIITNQVLTWNNWNQVVRQVRTATPEQAAAHLQRIEESRRRQAEIDRERTKASQRAERLLLELLDENQAKDYRDRKKFRVIGSDGETYEIDARQAHGNIDRIGKNGRAIENYCVPLSDCDCPTPDHIVAQLLALKANIDHLLEKANRMEIMADGTRRMLPRRQRA